MEESFRSISRSALERLTRYLNFLKGLPKDGPCNISSTMIAEEFGLNPVQVRKDLAAVGSGGKPKIGYIRDELILDIVHFLGYDDVMDAILVGVGNLGKALLSYDNFKQYGLAITAAFDVDEKLIGMSVADKRIFPLAKLPELCRRLNVRIGIVTVPAAYAQEVCDLMIEGGIRAVWNFAPVHLNVPENVVVKNENMAASLAVLSKMLTESFAEYGV